MSGTEPAKAEDGLEGTVQVCACACACHVRERRGALWRLVGSQPCVQPEQVLQSRSRESPALSCKGQAASPLSEPTPLLCTRTAAPHRVKAPKGLWGFSRGLVIRNLPQVLLLPWVQQGLGVKVLAAALQSGKFSELPQARSLSRPGHTTWAMRLSPSFATSKLFKLPLLCNRDYSSVRHPACVGYYLGMLLRVG